MLIQLSDEIFVAIIIDNIIFLYQLWNTTVTNAMVIDSEHGNVCIVIYHWQYLLNRTIAIEIDSDDITHQKNFGHLHCSKLPELFKNKFVKIFNKISDLVTLHIQNLNIYLDIFAAKCAVK